jgi:hypothetical protein
VADTPAAAAHRFEQLAVALTAGGIYLTAHRDIAKFGKAAALRAGGVMHPWSKRTKTRRTARLGASTTATTQRAVIRPSPAGLWAIREKGAKGHVEPRTSKRRNAGRSVIKFGDDQFAAGPVDHPGAHARPAWEQVRAAVALEAPKLVDRAVVRELSRLFARG